MRPSTISRRTLRPGFLRTCAVAAVCGASLAPAAPGDAAAPSPKRDAPVTRPADEGAAALRAMANLDRLMLFRRAAEEADLDEELKRQLLDVMEGLRRDLLKMIRENAASTPKEREAAVRAVHRQFSTSLERVAPRNSPAGRALLAQSLQITRETDLLAAGKERFAATVARAGLDLDARQVTAVDALLAETARKLPEPVPDDRGSVREHRMNYLLTARADLRRLLSDEQWGELGGALAAEAAAEEAKRRRGSIRVEPNPVQPRPPAPPR